ncbi:MAG: CopG family transcriptional regulator [bacterium]|nr:CopG family transcriptional regulator [bacterium]
MSNPKTAISIQEPLLKEADSLARELKLSRSRLFAIAMAEFIQRQHNKKLLQRINEAYIDNTDASDEDYLQGLKKRHRELIEGQW